MANERNSENLAKKMLVGCGYTSEGGFVIEEQISSNPSISKCLAKASKKGSGGPGRPEFVIYPSASQDTILVVECKAEAKHHESKDLMQPAAYAVDGALHYARHLSAKFNVIAIGFSGSSEKTCKISVYFWQKGAKGHERLMTAEDIDGKRVPITSILRYDEYLSAVYYNPAFIQLKHKELSAFSRKLHNEVREELGLGEANKPLLIAGILLALHDDVFRKGYSAASAKHFPKLMHDAIVRQINEAQEDASIPEAKADLMRHQFAFIAKFPKLGLVVEKDGAAYYPLKEIVREVEEKVVPLMSSHLNYDVIGQFYGEFIRYTSGDGKGLGIVLTPRHLTELAADVIDVGPGDIVIDTCCGTSGFLIAAMQRMLRGAQSREEVERIKKECLIGIEDEPNMYTLAAANMIFRGDGKSNLICGSSLDWANLRKFMNKTSRKDTAGNVLYEGTVTKGLINPPFSQGPGKEEMRFAINLLDMMKQDGIAVVIMPISCVSEASLLKQELMSRHTVEAVMSLPEEIFYPTATVTVMAVFRAHRPHQAAVAGGHLTWLGYWRDDRFLKQKNVGRVDVRGTWPEVKKSWLQSYRRKEVLLGHSAMVDLKWNDEWCAEAYLQPDYSKVHELDFKRAMLEYAIYEMRLQANSLALAQANSSVQ